jgi:DNA-binding GntR family transcriptional regulator
MINLKGEAAHQRRCDAIVFGRLKPGEKIVRETVAEMLNVGRTPCKALGQLKSEGYLRGDSLFMTLSHY